MGRQSSVPKCSYFRPERTTCPSFSPSPPPLLLTHVSSARASSFPLPECLRFVTHSYAPLILTPVTQPPCMERTTCPSFSPSPAPFLLPPILPRRCECHFRAPMCDRSTHSHHILALYAEKPHLLKRNAGSSMFALTSIPPLRTLSCSLLLTWSIVCAPCITTTVSMVELVLAPSTGCARLFTTSTHCGNEIYF